MSGPPKILVFGGTTEGRKAAAVCDKAGHLFYYSTKTGGQEIAAAHAIRLTGALDREAMSAFCRENDIRLIVDAAHPFAEELRAGISHVSRAPGIPVVRYERIYPGRDPRLLWFKTYEKAVEYLNEKKIDRLLALTGVGSIARLKDYWIDHDCRFRILDRPESTRIAAACGFPAKNLLFYSTDGDDEALFAALRPGAILTKESGESGGFSEKARITEKLGIPLLVIRRPEVDPSFIKIYGPHGLRREIERLAPGFFALRTGLTTGTCATAAAVAALHALTGLPRPDRVTVELPDGEPIEVSVADTLGDPTEGRATVIKDAGDDPDVTGGLSVVATVRWNDTPGLIVIAGGEGVGTVTLPGLGLPVGGPAIGAVPRRMIEENVRALLDGQGIRRGIDIAISVPGGEAAAARTFNAKLGVTGGLSILGTSGIVQPFSAEAFAEALRREMAVARAVGCNHLILNSGARSERLLRERVPDLPPQAFVHYGNAIGEALRLAAEAGFERVTLGVMIGKAVKLAAGALDTHSRVAAMDTGFLQHLAAEAGCSPQTVERIGGIALARELWRLVPPAEHRFFELLAERCRAACDAWLPGVETILLPEPRRP